MYSEEERDFLFSLSVPQSDTTSDKQPVLEFSLSYFDVLSSSIKTVPYTATVNRGKKAEGKNDAVKWQFGRVTATEALEEADKLGKQGKYTEGQQLLRRAKSQVERLENYTKSPLCVQLCEDLDEATSAMQDTFNYRSVGQYQMKSKMMEHSYQRSCSSKATPNVYRSSAKKSMMGKWEKERQSTERQSTISETSANSFRSDKWMNSPQSPARMTKPLSQDSTQLKRKSRSNSIRSMFGFSTTTNS